MTKTYGEPITPILLSRLADEIGWLDPQRPVQLRIGDGGTMLLSASWEDTKTLNRAFTARCGKADVRRITVHDARRTCASLLVDLDVHPRVVMQVLRHAQIAVTMEIYAKASSGATREALRRLGGSIER